MRIFPDDASVQLEGCMLLASVGELLYNNGYATEVFKLLEVDIRKHADEAELLCQAETLCSKRQSVYLFYFVLCI